MKTRGLTVVFRPSLIQPPWILALLTHSASLVLILPQCSCCFWRCLTLSIAVRLSLSTLLKAAAFSLLHQPFCGAVELMVASPHQNIWPTRAVLRVVLRDPTLTCGTPASCSEICPASFTSGQTSGWSERFMNYIKPATLASFPQSQEGIHIIRYDLCPTPFMWRWWKARWHAKGR